MAVLATLIILGGITFVICALSGREPEEEGEIYTDAGDVPRPKWADEVILTGSQTLVFRNEKRGLEEVWIFEDGIWRRR